MKYAYFIIAAVTIIACSNPANPDTPAPTQEAMPSSVLLTDAQLQNAHLETGKMQVRNLGNSIKVSGFVEAPPQNRVSVSFPLGGYLKQTKLLPGMRVRRGEILATLEDPQYINLQQAYLTAQARLEFLAADLVRQEALNRDQSASDKTLQMARTEHKTEKINLLALAEKLRLIGINPENLSPETISKSVQIHAPINGFVSDVYVNIGQYLSPTDVLFELVNTDDMHLIIKVFEKDIPMLQKGQKIRAYALADPSKTFDARVLLISQNVGDDRSIEVHCHLEKNEIGLLPGMFIAAEIDAKNRDVLVIPNDAVLRFEDKNYVFVAISAHQFDLMEVSAGANENGFTELIGADSKEMMEKNIVTKNAYTLLMKLKNTEGE